MKKFLQLSIALSLVLLLTSAMKAQISCGTTITSNLTLTSDLDCSGFAGPAITIAADNVTLDLNGHTIITKNNNIASVVIAGGVSNVTITSTIPGGRITGNGSAAILLESGTISNVTISNLDLCGMTPIFPIKQYGNGISTSPSGNTILNGLLIENVLIDQREISCNIITTSTCSDVIIRNSQFNSSIIGKIGLILRNINNLTLSDLSLQNNKWGIEFGGISGNILISNNNLAGCSIGIIFKGQLSGFPTIVPGMFTGFGSCNTCITFLSNMSEINSNITIDGVDLSWTTNETRTGNGISHQNNYTIDQNPTLKNLLISNVTIRNRSVGLNLQCRPLEAICRENITITNSVFENNYSGLDLGNINNLNLSNLSVRNNTKALQFGEIKGIVTIDNINLGGSEYGILFKSQPAGFPTIVPGMFTGLGEVYGDVIHFLSKTSYDIAISGLDLSWSGAGVSGKGIFCLDVDGLLIENVIVKKRNGLYISGSLDSTTYLTKNVVVKNSLFEEGQFGIWIRRNSGLELSNVSLRNNSFGIHFGHIFSGNISINDVDLSGCNTGIVFQGFVRPLTVNSSMFHGFGTVVRPIVIDGNSDQFGGASSNILISGLDLSWTGDVKTGYGIYSYAGDPTWTNFKGIVIDNVIVNNRLYAIKIDPKNSSDLEIKNSTFKDNNWGLYFSNFEGLKLHNNNIKGNTYGGLLLYTVINSSIYHNNICGAQTFQVTGNQPYELWNHETLKGNYWCVSCDDNGFIPGTTSNRLDIIDNYAYGTESGWLLPLGTIGSQPCSGNQPPIAICKDVIISTDAISCTANASIDDGSYDPDGDEIKITQVPAGPYTVGTTEVTLTITDSHGESASCTGTVTVVDDIPPVAITQNITVELCNGTASITADMIDNGSSDNCGIASMTLDKYNFNCEDAGKNIAVNLEVTDIHNNVASSSAYVTVDGAVPSGYITVEPEKTIPEGEVHTIYLGYGTQIVTLYSNISGGETFEYSWYSIPYGFSSNDPNPTVSPTETTTYFLEVTNEYGCKTPAPIEITVNVKDWRCGKDFRKIMLCHNGKEICVDENAVQSHLDHGDKLGSCNPYTKGSINQETAMYQYEVNREEQKLEGFDLLQNYPNPFGDGTVIEFRLEETMDLTLKIYDGAGKLVEECLSGIYNKGTYIYTYYPKDLTTSWYVCVLTCNGYSKFMNMKLIK